MAITPLITDAELLSLGIAANALGSIPSGDRDAAREAASGLVLSYYQKRFCLPLISWEADTKLATAQIARYLLIAKRGYDPSRGNDQSILDGYNAATAWLDKVRSGGVEPVGIVDSTPEVHEAAPLVSTSGDGPLWPVYGSRRGCR
jgi:phage gp36-like protein